MAMIVIHNPFIFIIILLMFGCGKYEKTVEKLEFIEPETFTCDVVLVKSVDRILTKGEQYTCSFKHD